MKEATMAKMGAILIFVGMFCATPVLAAMDPALLGQFSGKIGKPDGFISGKISAFSELKNASGVGKPEGISTFSPSLRPEMDLSSIPKDFSSLKNAKIEWDPSFIYSAHRTANRIRSCHF